jgi:hypothetical protein
MEKAKRGADNVLCLTGAAAFRHCERECGSGRRNSDIDGSEGNLTSPGGDIGMGFIF